MSTQTYERPRTDEHDVGVRGNGLGVPVLVMVVLAMMVLPLPAFLLDVLFTFNITLSLIILLAVIYVRRALEFASFPTVLLRRDAAAARAERRLDAGRAHQGAHRRRTRRATSSPRSGISWWAATMSSAWWCS